MIKTLTVAAALCMVATPCFAKTIQANTCSASDVQTALNTAVEGDTVVVPNGTCTWTTKVSISGKGIHLQGKTKGSVVITHSAGTSNLLSVQADATHSVEVSNLNFMPGTGSNPAYYMGVTGTGKPVLVHDNYMRLTDFGISCIQWKAKGGVIWGNEFETLDPAGTGQGCIPVSSGDSTSWTTPSSMGTADTHGDSNVYIEDNTFRAITAQVIDPAGNARVVIRYNRFDNSSMSSHGADTAPEGMRHVELYNNTFVFTTSGTGYQYPLNLNWWAYMRGGTWVVTDNVVPDIRSSMWGNKQEFIATVQNIRRRSGPYPCWATYPAPYQFGQGHNGTTSITEPAYFWNNTGTGVLAPQVDNYDPDDCGANRDTNTFIRQGRDYFVDTPKPGYQKYAYPHPLRSLQDRLPAPTNLRVQ